MQKTMILLPTLLKVRVRRRARKLGLSMAQFIRQSLEQALPEQEQPAEQTLLDLSVL